MRGNRDKCMKNRCLTGSVMVICLLLAGCGVTDNDADIIHSESEQGTASIGDAQGESEEESEYDAASIGNAPEEIEDETGTPPAPQEVGSKTDREILPDCDYALAYYEFLKEYAKESSWVEMGHAKFTLAFIDDDEVPELLLLEDNSHAAGVGVYTYYQNEVIELGGFGSFGTMQYVERGGMIFSHFMGQGAAYSSFFQLDGGTVKQISNLHSWPNYEDEYAGDYYEIDEVSVSEETFEAKWDELYESREYVLIGYDDGITIKEEELASLLAEAIASLTCN